MRKLAWLLALLVLAPGAVAWTVGLPQGGLAGGWPWAPAEPGETADARAGDVQPHVRIELILAQEGARGNVTLVEDEEEVFRQDFAREGPGMVVVRAEVPPGMYLVVFRGSDASSWWEDDEGIDTRDCDGGYLVRWVHGRLPPGGPEIPPGISRGCTTPPAVFHTLLHEAREAASLPEGRGSVAVPPPRDLDRGAFLAWSSGPFGNTSGSKGVTGDPPWEELEPAPFAWMAAGYLDRWTRPVEGHALNYAPPRLLSDGEMTIEGCLADPDRSTPLPDIVHPNVALYAPGATAPEAQLAPLTRTWSSDSNLLYLGCGEDGFLAQEALIFHSPDSRLECLHRFPLQGSTVREGQRIAGDRICADGRLDPSAEWIAGRLGEHLGFRALPLYRIERMDSGTLVTRVWLAEGLPYPLEVERAGGGERMVAVRWAFRLHAFEAAGQPLVEAPPPAPVPVHTEPFDPLRGPALVRHRDRFLFPLDEAVDAALATAGLVQRHPVLLDPDAILAMGYLKVRRDAQQAGADAESHQWALTFTSPTAGYVFITCERPVLHVTGQAVSLPVAHCQDIRSEGQHFFNAPPAPLGRADLPEQAITFDVAVDRFDTLFAQDGGANIRHAMYAPWAHRLPGATADFAGYRSLRHGIEHAGTITIGLGESTTGLSGPSDPPLDDVALVTLDLLDGGTWISSSGVTQTFGRGPATPLSPGGAGGGSGGLGPPQVVLAGAGPPALPEAVALGLLGTLAVLLSRGGLGVVYTRLARPELLTLEARRRVHALVAAEPGVHLREVARHLGGGTGPAAYHLRVLVREGFLTSVVVGRQRHYFINGRHAPKEMRRLAALRNLAARRMHALVRAQPGLSVSDLAGRMGTSIPAASKAARRLEEAGLLTRERAGREVRLRARREGA